MNNKPVGYFIYDQQSELWEQAHVGIINRIPLYTHPAKTLTDEEIMDVYCKTDGTSRWVFDFARAIIKKAQNK